MSIQAPSFRTAPVSDCANDADPLADLLDETEEEEIARDVEASEAVRTLRKYLSDLLDTLARL